MLLDRLTEAGRRVEAGFSTYIAQADIPEPLRGAMLYSLMAGGKRLRPALLFEAGRLAGAPEDALLPFACAIEMIHTYSLIHDDLPGMDNDDLRRGKPTNHKVYGEGMAILAGDGLLNRAYEIMLAQTVSAGPEQMVRCARAAKALADGAGVLGMIAGQCVDLEAEKREVSAETLDYIDQHKTAALLIAPLLAGAHLGDAGPDLLAALTSYGREIGVAFQIVDDILDLEGDAAILGKAVGRDQVLGKQTYPQRYGLEGARRLAGDCIKRAKAALAGLPGDLAFFLELADFIVTRKS